MSRPTPVGHGRQHAGIRLRLTYEAFIAAVFTRLAEQGFDDLRPAHAQVFQHFKEGGVRLTELARAAGVRPQSMASLVDELERLGYLQRVRDPRDRRAALISPTDRGKAEVQAARKVIAGLEREWARAVGKERFDALMDDLDSMREALSSEPN